MGGSVATGDNPWLEGRAAGTTEGYTCGGSLARFEYFVAVIVVRGVYYNSCQLVISVAFPTVLLLSGWSGVFISNSCQLVICVAF